MANTLKPGSKLRDEATGVEVIVVRPPVRARSRPARGRTRRPRQAPYRRDLRRADTRREGGRRRGGLPRRADGSRTGEAPAVLGLAPPHHRWALPDRQLHRRGVVARVRSIRHRRDDSVKLRPVAPADLPTSLRRSKDFVVEIAYPGTHKVSQRARQLLLGGR